MSDTDIRTVIESLTNLIWERDREALSRFVKDLPATDLPLVLSRLDSSDLSELLEILDSEDAAGLLLNLKELSPRALLSKVSPKTAASVIVYFEDTLTRLIALAAFLPIISDMSGCSGNQAVAVSMRELSLGLVRPREVLRVWGKEVSVGLINGVSLGVLLGLVAWLWRGNPTLGIVVGVALALNTIVAVSIGGSVPLILKGLGVDPALASGPILTTVTDICGFFFALGLAALALSHGFL